MICWVAERAAAAQNVSRTIVATDDERIVAAVKEHGYEAVLTRRDHRSGTDRIAEVAASLPDTNVIVNVQGDEPIISPRSIELAIEELIANPQAGIATTWEPMDSIDGVLNPNAVKIVVDDSGKAIYFSRSAVPFPRDAVREHGSLEAALIHERGLVSTFRKHTGLYVYRRDVLLDFARWPQSDLEKIESLEQLRAMQHGCEIRAVQAAGPSVGVDNEADLERVRAILEQKTVLAAPASDG